MTTDQFNQLGEQEKVCYAELAAENARAEPDNRIVGINQ